MEKVEVTSIKVSFEEKKKTFDILILVDGKNNVFLTNTTKNPKKVQCNLRLKQTVSLKRLKSMCFKFFSKICSF